MNKELEYKDFSPTAKKGIHKFSALSSKQMERSFKDFEKETGKRATHIDNKEHFYSYISKSKKKW